MILADTSIWVDHFRSGNRKLDAFLRKAQVVIHPFVVGELACGNLRKRAETLANLRKLPSLPVSSEDDVHYLLESRHLWGMGLGWVDMHLLTSALVSGHRLWTDDRALRSAAQLIEVAW